MDSRWFANRGQIVQVTFAAFGAFLSLMVWLAIPPQNLLYVAPIVFVACLMWAVWKIAAWYTLSHLPSAVLETPPSALPPSFPPPVEAKKDDGSIPVQVHFSTLVCSLGERYQIGGDHLIPITITIRELRKFDETSAPTLVAPPVPDYEAEVELEYQGMLYGGAQVKREGLKKRFCVPANSEAIHPEPYSVFRFHFTEKTFHLFAIRVYHINMNTQTATIHVAHAYGARL